MRVKLPVRPPLDAEALLGHFRARSVPGIEEGGEHRYSRSLSLPGGAAVAELAIGATSVVAELDLADDADVDAASRACAPPLGLNSDPAVVLVALGDDPLLGAAAR